jgi:hypothetical protein
LFWNPKVFFKKNAPFLYGNVCIRLCIYIYSKWRLCNTKWELCKLNWKYSVKHVFISLILSSKRGSIIYIFVVQLYLDNGFLTFIFFHLKYTWYICTSATVLNSRTMSSLHNNGCRDLRLYDRNCIIFGFIITIHVS